MAFPYNQENQMLTEQAIVAGVAAASANGQGFFRVSTMNTIAVTTNTSPLSADSSSVSTKSGDAGLFRVSAIGGTAGDNILVDGVDQTISATAQRVSGSVSSGANGLVVYIQNRDDAVNVRVSGLSKDAGTLLVSAKQGDAGLLLVSSKQGDAALLRISGIQGDGVNLNVSAKSLDAGTLLVSAKQGDGGLLRVSGLSPDAATFRVSAIGGTAGDNVLVDGTDQSISATVLRVSGTVSSGSNGLVVYVQNRDDAVNVRVSGFSKDGGTFRVSGIIDSGSVSAKSTDAGTFLVSSKQGDAGLLRISGIQGDAGLFLVSAKQGDGALLRVSSLNQDANFMHVSGFSPDAGLFLVSAKQGDAGLLRVSGIIDNGSVSAKSSDAGTFLVSAKQGDAGLLRVSGILDSGSVSAKSGDANQVHVSAVQGDAGLLLVSAKSGDGNQFHVSAVQGDGSLLRVSTLQSAVTTNTGGTSVVFVSSGATSQVSTAKSSGGRLYGWYIGNPAGVDQYLQVFNTSGGATAGTDAPVMSLYVPTLGGSNMAFPPGIAFSNGIQYIGTSTVNGQTIGASALRINLFYA